MLLLCRKNDRRVRVRDTIFNEISIGSLNWDNEVEILTSFLDSLFKKDEWIRYVEFDRLGHRAGQKLEVSFQNFKNSIIELSKKGFPCLILS